MHEHWAGCADLHKFHVHGHVDGEELLDGVRLPQDQGVLQGKARTRVPGNFDQEYQQYLLYRYYLEYQVQTRNNQCPQVVDMRWGVRDEMTDEHMTTVRSGWKYRVYISTFLPRPFV